MEQKLQSIIEKAKAEFKKHNCHYDIYPYMGLAVAIEITWGDWKHDHAFVDYIMRELGLTTKFGEETTEEDGSDTYSSIHYFVPNPSVI